MNRAPLIDPVDPPHTSPDRPDRGLAPAVSVMAAVFLAFLMIGMAMPVLPLHVHDVLGFGPFVVGLVAGGQFLASLLSRLWAGRLTDTRGPKRAMILGLIAGALGGGCYLASLVFLATPVWSVALLLVGRTLLGGAESLIITSGMLWGLALVAADRSAKVIAWVGMAMFAAMAVGAPIGSAIYEHFAFAGIAVASTIIPLAALTVIMPLRALIPATAPKGNVRTVLSAVLLPGLGFALSGVTFGSMTAFLTLYFSVEGWAHGALAFSLFAVALIVARIVGGHLPDRHGGARVAGICLFGQAAGLLVIATAPSATVAMLGAVIAGAGFSLVFPSLGLEAVRRAPAANRGMAMGLYNAFLDLTLGLGSPALGLLAGQAGLGSVFLASAVAAIVAVPIAWRLLPRGGRPLL
ncbi:arabinose transporter [Sandaracinobacteroides hominis]|uniref:arabinose transporter n=1 Tax=Sandaracinobacteroides hominis TaxID=2780086 RepID=UPI001A9C9A3D|nr:arabinose transporter [Sandaracinobacteroides hominis]